jgi:putative CRISPR-associated protein (TIGR02619 family)
MPSGYSGKPVLHLMTCGASLLVGASEPGTDERKALDDHQALKDLERGGWSNEVKRKIDAAVGEADGSSLHDCVGSAFRELLRLDPAEEVAKRGDRFGRKDKLPGELSYLQLLYEGRDPSPQRGRTPDMLVLLSSATARGYLCARLLQLYVERKKAGEDNTSFCAWLAKPEVVVVEGLQPHDKEQFQGAGVLNLVSAMHEQVQAHADGRDIVLNLTGGFKGAIPHFTMLASCFEGLRVNYLFEDSPRIIEIPTMPLHLDVFSWRDHRALVQVIPEMDDGSRLLARLPSTLRCLFTASEEGLPEPSFLHALMRTRFESAEAKLRPHGPGHLLVDRISDASLRGALIAHIERWQHAWAGDQVPEMVEHQRGHTQRVLELAEILVGHLLEEVPGLLTDEELFVLIGAIWLHDVGHAGRYVTLDDSTRVSVAGFPTLIRDLHHLLAATVLEEDEEALQSGRPGVCFFPVDGVQCGRLRPLAECVKWISKYHRQRMPIRECAPAYGDAHPLVKAIGKPVPEVISGAPGSPIRVRLLTALYRVLDASDLQTERAGGRHYQAVRTAANVATVLDCLGRLAALRSRVPQTADGDDLGDVVQEGKNAEACVSKWLTAIGISGQLSIPDASRKLLRYVDRIRADKSGQVKDAALESLLSEVSALALTFKHLELSSGGDRTASVGPWLSCLNTIVFELVQPLHYRKHEGVHSILYLPKPSRDVDGTRVHPFKVVAVCENGREPQGCFALRQIQDEFHGVQEELSGIEFAGRRHGVTIEASDAGEVRVLEQV